MGSAKRRCMASAASCASSGRSRTSWIESAETITITSLAQPRLLASSNMRPRRGSMGRRASWWPIAVRRGSCMDFALIAPISVSSATPSAIARRSGGSMKGKSATLPRRSAAICKITLAREVRRISGSVYGSRPSKSVCEYRRIATPSATRPQRPLRWFALAWLMGSMGRRCTLVLLE